MNKQFLGILFVIVALLIGVFVLTKDKSPSPAEGGQVSNHVTGKGIKGVTLIEYGDFQCPACKSYYPIVKEVRKAYGDDVKFVFRHFPLIQIHNNAFIASRAAEAAGLQDKFFEMHDLMYENQESWSQLPDPTKAFEQFAAQLELNQQQFKQDMSSETVSATINADIQEAKAAGAASTPTFVINGERIEENPQDVKGFKALIDEAIAKSKNSQ
jgi:protein-disulfide isomerase